jgi:predicted phosphodiesterase
VKILPLSDLHFEFGRLVPQHFVKDLPEADLCILAGDIYPHRLLDQSKRVLEPFVQKYKDVVYVAGNHEYYQSSPRTVSQILEKMEEEHPNFHWLQNDFINIGGHTFYGGTMWFSDAVTDPVLKNMMSDFSVIKDFEPWVYGEHNDFVDKNHTDLIERRTIVISHHLPSPRSILPAYGLPGVGLNHFFMHDMEKVIKERRPRLWIHGHTHHYFNYWIDGTRVFCNPLGYPHELRFTRWEPEVIEI